MRLNAVKVLEISITNSPKKEILEEISKYLQKRPEKTVKPLVIFTPNTEQLVRAVSDSTFADILNRADISLPDSNGVVWASRVLTKNTLDRPVHGVDFMEDLVKLASERHVPIALIGGRANLAVETFERLHQKYPTIIGFGENVPEVTIENNVLHITNSDVKKYFQELSQKIKEQKVQIVFVGLGPPKQEYFIEELAKYSQSPVVLMAVGGSFAIISGRLPRAPKWMRAIGMEWLWRLMLEPWRIFRQLALLKFVFLVYKEKLSGSRS